MARQRPTVGRLEELEGRISRLQARLEHEDECRRQFGKDITCRVLIGSCYDRDERGKMYEPLADPQVGELVIIEYWTTWMGGSDPTGFRFVGRVKSAPKDGQFVAVALCSYVPLLERNEFFAFDSRSTRTLAR